ncbi:MAG: serine hydrolase domain-containing protein [Saprospiraceae bacterium]
MKIQLSTNLLFLFFVTSIYAQHAPTIGLPESVGISGARLDKLDKQMHEFVDHGQLAGVQTAILRKGQLVHFDTYGFADLDRQQPLEDNSIWRIYSMTKPIVSVALMMLYEDGKFQLNDPLYKYIPEMKDLRVHTGGRETAPAKNHIRIIDVLRHTTGFGYGWGPNTYVDSLYKSANRSAMKDNKAFVQHLSTLPLYYEPGTGWRYSVSTDVCGYLVEVLSGQPLDQFLSTHIFKPLGMEDTHFEVPDEKDDRFVTNYTTEESGKLKVIDHPETSRYTKEVTMFSGGGGLVSTTMDYMRFSQMLLNGGELDGARILSPKTIELMTKDHTQGITHAGGPIVLPGKGISFGLGFSVTTDLAATEAIGSEGSYGWGGAAGTFFRIDPKEDMIILLMIQLMPYNHLQARETFQTMVYQAIIE